MRRNRQKEKTPDASVHISPSIPGMAAVILPIVLRRSALWYIQIKFSSSTVKCIIPHTSNSFFLVLAGAFFGARTAIRGGSKFIRPVFILVVLALTARLAWQHWF